jgi:leucyl aminopeptidase (aminopeptidase T)
LKCDNDVWTRKVLESNEGVGLCRIGEIALVPNNTPISYVDVAKYNESDHKIVLSQTESSDIISSGNFESIFLDENTGCHFALGTAYKEATDLGYNVGDYVMRDNNFNVSDYHYDFVFGNDSIMVEAETEGHKKVLLMDKGIWKI